MMHDRDRFQLFREAADCGVSGHVEGYKLDGERLASQEDPADGESSFFGYWRERRREEGATGW
jgi:hypothetical protein